MIRLKRFAVYSRFPAALFAGLILLAGANGWTQDQVTEIDDNRLRLKIVHETPESVLTQSGGDVRTFPVFRLKEITYALSDIGSLCRMCYLVGTPKAVRRNEEALVSWYEDFNNNDIVITGENEAVGMIYRDGSGFRMKGNTELRLLDPLKAENDPTFLFRRVVLIRGKILVAAKDDLGRRGFLVETPDASVRVKTRSGFRVEYNPTDAFTRVDALNGDVIVTPSWGEKGQTKLGASESAEIAVSGFKQRKIAINPEVSKEIGEVVSRFQRRKVDQFQGKHHPLKWILPTIVIVPILIWMINLGGN